MKNLTVELSVSKNDLPHYLVYLEKAGMLGQLRDETGGLRSLGKVKKIFVDNPNLMYTLQGHNVNQGSLRETEEPRRVKSNSRVIPMAS